MQVVDRFSVDGDDGGAGGRKRFEIAIRLADHQVHVERQGRGLFQRGDYGNANRDVRHEVPVHHIHMNLVGAATLHLRDLVGQPREIRRQDRRCNADAHRLTSSVMASPCPMRKPGCGVCRTTMPGGRPGYGTSAVTAMRNLRPLNRSAEREPSVPIRSGTTKSWLSLPRFTSRLTCSARCCAGGSCATMLPDW